MPTRIPIQKPWFLTIALAMTFALLGSSAAITAQESSIPVDAPVDVHPGTCEDMVAEPQFDA